MTQQEGNWGGAHSLHGFDAHRCGNAAVERTKPLCMLDCAQTGNNRTKAAVSVA
jgi:hypothetical protein